MLKMPPKKKQTSRQGASPSESCCVCCQSETVGKDEALFCTGSCQKWLHRYCASQCQCSVLPIPSREQNPLHLSGSQLPLRETRGTHLGAKEHGGASKDRDNRAEGEYDELTNRDASNIISGIIGSYKSIKHNSRMGFTKFTRSDAYRTMTMT